MNDAKTILTIVYGPFASNLGGGQQIMVAFNDAGLINEITLEDEYSEMFKVAPAKINEGSIGAFRDLEVLQKYSFNLCQKLGNAGVSLVSLESYNEALGQSYKVDELRTRLEECGNFIKNPDAEKNGFFNKIFS